MTEIEATKPRRYKKRTIRFIVGGLVAIVPILIYLVVSIVVGVLDT